MEKSKKLRAKKKKILKRKIKIFSTVIILGGSVIFLLKAPIFNVKYVEIEASEAINKEELSSKSEFVKGKNIFLLKNKDFSPIVDSDLYINDIKVKKQGINSIKLVVEDTKINYFYQINDTKYILNDKYQVLDVTPNDTNQNLIKLELSSITHKNKGEDLSLNDVQKDILSSMIPYLDEIQKYRTVKYIDINNITNIIIGLENVQIIMGDSNDIKDKLNIALNILDDESIGIQAGYINVAVKDVPVIKKEEVPVEEIPSEEILEGETNTESTVEETQQQ